MVIIIIIIIIMFLSYLPAHRFQVLNMDHFTYDSSVYELL